MLKVIIRGLISFFCSAYYRLRGMQVHSSLIFFMRVHGSLRHNRAVLSGAKVSEGIISMDGHDNSLVILGNVFRTRIEITGTGNTVRIGKQCSLAHSRLVIRGNNLFVSIGAGTTVGSMFLGCMGDGNSLTIGEGCMFSEEIDVWNSDSHPLYNASGELINPSQPVHIGNHVWVGKRAKILKGVTIGDNAVIGMDSMVTKDVESNTLCAGNPLRVIKSDINWDRSFIDQ